MPQHAKNPQHRFYFYPVEPPEDVFDWASWPSYQVCIPGPLISYLLNVMKIYQWPGRVKTDDPAAADSFVQAWNDLIARVGASVECDPMPYPILRQNPENACQTQQSLDGGATWTVVIDTSVCQPVIPPMIRLRQNPTQPQLLEQSLDSGATWTTAYDYSKYKQPLSRQIENNSYNNEVNNYTTENTTLWDESSHDVNIFAPDLVFDGTAKDGDRNKAICYASRVFVSAIMEIAFQSAAHPGGGDSLAALAFTAVTTGIGAWFGGPFGAAIGAFFGAGLIELANRGTDAYTREVYGQYEDNLVCCMYTALKDSIPTQAAFAAAFSGSDCVLDSTAQKFVDEMLTPLLTQDKMFLAFLRSAAEGVSLGDFLPDCPCEPQNCLDFKSAEQDAISAFPGSAQWFDGKGWGNELNAGVSLKFQYTNIPDQITKVHLTYFRSWNAATSNPYYDMSMGQIESATGTAGTMTWGMGADQPHTGQEITIEAPEGTHWNKADLIISTWASSFTWPGIGANDAPPQYVSEICFNE